MSSWFKSLLDTLLAVEGKNDIMKYTEIFFNRLVRSLKDFKGKCRYKGFFPTSWNKQEAKRAKTASIKMWSLGAQMIKIPLKCFLWSSNIGHINENSHIKSDQHIDVQNLTKRKNCINNPTTEHRYKSFLYWFSVVRFLVLFLVSESVWVTLKDEEELRRQENYPEKLESHHKQTYLSTILKDAPVIPVRSVTTLRFNILQEASGNIMFRTTILTFRG